MIDRAIVPVVGAILLFISLSCSATPAALSWSECPVPGDSKAVPVSAARMQCGWLSTGESLAGKPVELRVAVLRARPDSNDPVPVVYVPGGPGDAAGLNAAALAAWQRWQQRAGWRHDIVVFDPRGTGESRPRPACRSEDFRAPAAVPLRRASTPGEFDRASRQAARCYRDLGPATTAALGPDAQIEDLNALVHALGVERVTLWAVSYGTRIAQLYATRHPRRVHALVLDSMFPVGRDELLSMPEQIGAAINELDASCAAIRGACADEARKPSDILASLLARYQRQRPQILGIDRLGRVRTFRVSPYRLLLMVLLAGYDHARTADTVNRLKIAEQGRPQVLWPLVVRLRRQADNTARSEAVFWSTRCAFGDGVPSESQWKAALARYPLVAPYVRAARGAPVCDIWQVPRTQLANTGGGPVPPTLVVNGAHDPATPARWAADFVARHPQARTLLIPGAGHAVTLGNRCAQRGVSGFIDDPAASVMPDCGADQARSR